MYKKNNIAVLGTAIALFFLQLAHGQEVGKVHHYGELTPEEKRHSDLQKEHAKLLEECSELWRKANITHPNKQGFGTDNKELIKEVIAKNEELLGRINSAAGLRSALERLKSIEQELGVENSYDLRRIEDAARENIRNGEIRLMELREEESKEASAVDEHSDKIKEIDNEIDQLEEKNKNNSDILNRNNSSRSIDDFLADRGSSGQTDDFLSNSNSSNGDFLSDNNDSRDFLSKEDKTKWKIDNKDGKSGVITASGQVLIPYGNYTIVEYKNGIARIRILLDSYFGDEVFSAPGSKGRYTANVYKEGFIDKTGQFLDGYRIVSSGSFSSTGGYISLSSGNDDRTSAEKQRDEERFARKCRLNREREISLGREWEIRTIRKYQ